MFLVNLVLSTPVEGWVAPLDETPDAVFAQRMLGDGVAIDPIGSILRAPCAGEVLSLHRARHAITLRADNGAEILLHIGLDTVGLDGEGFSSTLAVGQRVQAGDPLIGFDLDLLASRARSLLIPVIVTNPQSFGVTNLRVNRLAQHGDALMELVALDAQAPSLAVHDQASLFRDVEIPLRHGLHARPAARIADQARRFSARIDFIVAKGQASAKSPVALLSLAIAHGQTVRISAQGADAAAALIVLGDLILSGMGEGEPIAAAKPALARALEPTRPEHRPTEHSPSAPIAPPSLPQDGVLLGVMAAPGLTLGKAVRLERPTFDVREQGASPQEEQAALTAALIKVRGHLAALAGAGPEARASVIQAHLAFVDDVEMVSQAADMILAGKSAGFAWASVLRGYAQTLRALGDARMAERADDLLDVEIQVLAALAGEEMSQRTLPEGAIVVAEDLLPSQFVALDVERLSGLCLARGGPTSHVAILAASMGLPALVALGAGASAVPDGADLILDASAGRLVVHPTAAATAAAVSALDGRRVSKARARAAARAPCSTLDERSIEVFANLGSVAQAQDALTAGADGCGLLRTEFLFLERQTPPDEDEQLAQYQAIAQALDGRPLIIRTLDVGGDKAAPYLPIPAEENPALGLRGVRVSLWRPHLLKTQIRAILRVRPAGQCKIMIPMVTSVHELRAVRTVVDTARQELGITTPIELGVMIETPAAAVTADLLAADADFLSIGTNDLTQYVLAMDRGAAELAASVDALHPAVLRMVASTCQGAAAHGRWVGVCGGLASDPVAVPILVGLGVTELSTTCAMAAEIKALIRTLSWKDCRQLAQQALLQTSPAAVRTLVRAQLTEF